MEQANFTVLGLLHLQILIPIKNVNADHFKISSQFASFAQLYLLMQGLCFLSEKSKGEGKEERGGKKAKRSLDSWMSVVHEERNRIAVAMECRKCDVFLLQPLES